MAITTRSLLFVMVVCFLSSGCKENITIESPQNNRSFGLKRSSASTLSSIPIASKRIYSGALPTMRMLTMPPVANQGTEGSCVAFAVAYANRSFQNGQSFYDLMGKVNTKNLFSPAYIFNQTNVGDCDGSYFVTTGQNAGALDKMKSEGVCSLYDMPYNDANGCTQQPNAFQRKQAALNKIERFERITDLSVGNLKVLLLNNFPIIIGAEVDYNFGNADRNFIWNSKGAFMGNHAMVICGYDDSKKAFRIINQWGESWGDNGYTWLDYDHLQNVVFEAYITYPLNSGNIAPASSGVWQGYYASVDKPNVERTVSQFIQNGVMKLPMSNSPYSYFWTNFNLDIPSNRVLVGDNLKIEMRVKNSALEGGLSAFDVGVSIIGEKQNFGVSFMGEAWAQYWASVSIGQMSYPNLAELVQSMDNYVTLTLETINGQLIVRYEGRELKRISYGNMMGNILQFKLGFKGSGSCDWLRVYQNGILKMRDEFNINGTSTVEWF